MMSQDMKDYREQIDGIDRQLVELIGQRMEVSKAIGAYKREHGLPTLDVGRERQKIAQVGAMAGERMADYAESIFRTIMAASRSYQNRCGGIRSKTYTAIREALERTPRALPAAGDGRLPGHRGGLFADRLRQHLPFPDHPLFPDL